MFVATKVLLFLPGQNYVCLDKSLSRQACFCHDKYVFCHDKYVFFSRFRDKHVFVATKIILVAVPANDSTVGWPGVTGYRVLPFRGVSLQSRLSPFWCYRFSIYTIHFSPLSVPVTSFSIICCPCSVLNLSLDLSSSFLPSLIPPSPHPTATPPPPPLTSSVMMAYSVRFCQKAYYNRTILQLIW